MGNNLPALAKGTSPGLRLADAKSLGDGLSNDDYQSTTDSVTASTTQTQAGGTAIRSSVTRITSANASDAVTLGFAATPGRGFTLINDSGQTIQLFPKSGDKLNDANTDAAVTVANNTISFYRCVANHLWFGGAVALET